MKLFAAIFALLFFQPAFAGNEAPVVYSRTILKIVPDVPVVKPAAAKDLKEKSAENTLTGEVLPTLPRVAKEFTVEVRPLSFLAQQDFIAHQPFTDNGGMLILIDPPARAMLKSSNLLAKVDVLFISEDGRVAKIAPDLSLANLPEPIDSINPVRAFVFLKNGAAKASDIQPGDHAQNPLFKAHPVVLE